MNQTLDFRSLFLEEFIKRIIIKSGPQRPKIEKKEVLLEKLEEAVVSPPKLVIEHKKIEPVKKIFPIVAKKPTQPTFTPKVIKIGTPEIPKLPSTKPIIPQAKPIIPQAKPIIPQAKPIIPQAKPIITPTPQTPKVTIMDRLNRIFSDPGVQVLNCPGPDKNITITRSGMMQTSPFSFNEKEIKEFMNELSEKTRIPLIPGIIKVIFQNLIITAVVSEFVGTKFIAERRQQGQLQAPPRIQFR